MHIDFHENRITISLNSFLKVGNTDSKKHPFSIGHSLKRINEPSIKNHAKIPYILALLLLPLLFLVLKMRSLQRIIQILNIFHHTNIKLPNFLAPITPRSRLLNPLTMAYIQHNMYFVFKLIANIGPFLLIYIDI